jgi:SNF2 family DNA or RNA helicase
MAYTAMSVMFADTEPHKIFLTGTPICNRSDDLIALVTLLNVEPYNDATFWKYTRTEKRVPALNDFRANYILRRTKEEMLASQLPKKEIRNVNITIEDGSGVYSKEYSRIQKRVYKPVITKILRLRQCVDQISLVHKAMRDDPNLLEEYKNQLPEEISAKLRYIKTTVENTPVGDKVVIFSQWTTMLDHIQYYLSDIAACAIYSGKLTREEKRDVLAKFNSDPSLKVLLISLKSGGCGLNLCVANHAIITEPYFNLAEERQAIDRIYRIGQTKNVFVHKLFVPSTVETWLQSLHKFKDTVTDAILTEEFTDELIEDITICGTERVTAFHQYVQ